MTKLVPHNEIFVDPLGNMLLQPLGDAELLAAAGALTDTDSRDLIAVCDTLVRLNDRMTELMTQADALDPDAGELMWRLDIEPVGDRMCEMAAIVAKLPATTSAERLAKAGIVLQYMQEGAVDADLAISLARDVLAA